MSITRSAFKAHTILQSFFPLTYHIKNEKLVNNVDSNVEYFSRNLSIGLTIFYHIFSIIQIFWLASNWNSDISNKAARLIVYVIVFSICTDAFVAYLVTRRHKGLLIAVVNECLKIYPKLKKIAAGKLSAYIVYASTLVIPALPTCTLVLPFLIDFMPYRLVWKLFQNNVSLIQTQFVIFIECTNYGLVTAINSGVFIAFVLVAIVMCEGIHLASKTMFSGYFYSCLLKHRYIFILVQHFNEVCYWVFGLVCSSVLLTGTCTCALIKLGSNMPIIMNLAFATILAGNLMLTVLLSYLGAIPNRAGKRFIKYWKHENQLLSNKIKRKYLSACPENMGYRVGMIRCVDSELGPNIINRTVDATVNILLIC